MKQVFGGGGAGEESGGLFGMTMEHVFSEVWSRDTLSDRERRLLLLGLLVGEGLDDVIELHLDTALRAGELTPDELRETVVFLTLYAGWPRAAKLSGQVEELIARHTGT
ncbi:carboxymuconolactone decarboxylase family protein [Microbispora sp. RL4-1S]|uniref:Carboxymuconolactone decarboxylase family protein n=1 Tax=Microbispora oryzae TaxID=2806554 RepID=A0A941AIY5_9ACTN|nr:carboxymuconolactone decarboxylase family protein [Microbispora oryzae]MBP2705730.1 carboxymuconolactone decarboxylase family protein [Microbispora oryzae]